MSEHFNAPESQFVQGYDPKFKEDATLELLDEIEDWYIDGVKKNTIMRWLREERGIDTFQSNFLTAKVWKKLVSDGKKRADNLLEKNLMRLERLYALSVDNGDYSNANKAIDTMNKLGQLYKEKVEVEHINTEFVLGGEDKEDSED